MPNKYVGIRNGNKVNEEGLLTRLLAKLSGTQNAGRIQQTAFAVSQAAPTPNLSVDIAAGDFIIPYLDYLFHAWSTVIQNLTLPAADPSNPRLIRIIAYIDLSLVDTTNSNSPDGVKFMYVAGLAAGSPTAPSDGAVQTAVGASNPWKELAEVRQELGVTSIPDAKITDKRSIFQLGGGLGGIILPQSGVATVANNVAPLIIAPKPSFFTRMTARCKVAPTGADLIARVNKNGVSIGTITIPAGSLVGTPVPGLSVSVALDDYFTLDITQIGSGTPGSSVVVALG